MDDKDLSFKKIFLLNLKMRWENFLEVHGWQGIYFFLFYSFYFTVGIIGFWKIRNVIGSMKISFFIDFIVNTGLLVLTILFIGLMWRRFLFGYSIGSLKHFINGWLECLVFVCFLFGYFAFFYPEVYMGETIKDDQLFKTMNPLIIDIGIPPLISLIQRICNLVRKIKL